MISNILAAISGVVIIVAAILLYQTIRWSREVSAERRAYRASLIKQGIMDADGNYLPVENWRLK